MCYLCTIFTQLGIKISCWKIKTIKNKNLLLLLGIFRVVLNKNDNKVSNGTRVFEVFVICSLVLFLV